MKRRLAGLLTLALISTGVQASQPTRQGDLGQIQAVGGTSLLTALSTRSIAVVEPKITLSPKETRYDNEESVRVRLSCSTEGAKIYYTTDGKEPTTASALYVKMFEVDSNTRKACTRTIKAIAVKEGQASEVVVKKVYFSAESSSRRRTKRSSSSSSSSANTSSASSTVTSTRHTFSDTWNHWAKESIDFVVAHHLFTGTSDTQFKPNDTMTRGMFVTVLGRLAGIQTARYQAPVFNDVMSSSWYTPYVQWAADNQIIGGMGNHQFGPNYAVTREQVAVMLMNYVNYAGIKLPQEKSATILRDGGQISSWAQEAVYTLQKAGIIDGDLKGYLDPKKPATRAEVATLLQKLMKVNTQAS